MLPKIKRCPFDNGKSELSEIENMTIGFGFSYWRVTCTRCGSGGPVAEGSVIDRKKEAIQLWNKRYETATN